MRRGFNNMCLTNGVFQSTHPVWDATWRIWSNLPIFSISIHASRMGCDTRTGTGPSTPTNFNPRIPYGMRPDAWGAANVTTAFQSTHPVWDATDTQTAAVRSVLISIHASRMGCDFGLGPVHRLVHISIHASRMGCDPPCRCRTPPSKHFNPRIPYGMRHARKKRVRAARGHFNPRIPYGMRLCGNNLTSLIGISIHASRMGCDAVVARRFTRWRISIHASRMGCDTQLLSNTLWTVDFNPRIPYGMRLFCTTGRKSSKPFQSTHPVWDATVSIKQSDAISTFQSTHPVWDATNLMFDMQTLMLISIHASRMGCDCENGHCIP